MRIPDSVLQAISDRLSIAEVVGEYVSLKPSGGRLWGLCPFHGEKTPSFSVTPDKGLFYCFGCHKGGNLFTFVMEMEKLTFVEAAKQLAEKAGVRIELDGDNREELRKSALQELYDRVAGSFHYILLERPEGSEARAYLASRGMSDATITAFRLGFAPRDRYWLFDFLIKKSYSEEFLRTSGLFTAKNPRMSLFGARIMFPIANQHGNIIAFGGRVMADEGPKYINSPETEIFRKSENLFGLDKAFPTIKATGQFIIVEGYTDVLALHQAGVTNAVAPLGTAFTEEQARRLRRSCERGALLFDADSAGRAAAAKAILLCERVGIVPEVIELPEGLDPAEVLVRQGPDALHNSTKYPINSFVYLVRKALDRHDVEQPEGKESVLRELVPYIDSIDSEVRKESTLGQLADALRVDVASVIRDYRRLAQRDRREAPRSTGVAPQRSARDAAASFELRAMLAVAVNREYFPTVRSRLSIDDLEEGRSRELFVALEECFRKGDATTEGLIAAIEDESLRTLVLECLSSDEYALNQEQGIKDSIVRIRRASLERRLSDVDSRIRRAQTEGRSNAPGDEIRQLQLDKMFLHGELAKLKVAHDDDRAAN